MSILLLLSNFNNYAISSGSLSIGGSSFAQKTSTNYNYSASGNIATLNSFTLGPITAGNYAITGNLNINGSAFYDISVLRGIGSAVGDSSASGAGHYLLELESTSKGVHIPVINHRAVDPFECNDKPVYIRLIHGAYVPAVTVCYLIGKNLLPPEETT